MPNKQRIQVVMVETQGLRITQIKGININGSTLEMAV